MYENVTLFCASDSGAYPIKIETPDGLVALDKYGCYSSNEHAKCVIFPKGKTTWEGFVSLCKFDITTLVSFESRVLVRDCKQEKWTPAIWGFYNNDAVMNYPYECICGAFAQCIPYEGNEHLLGTNNECNEYYKTWR